MTSGFFIYIYSLPYAYKVHKKTQLVCKLSNKSLNYYVVTTCYMKLDETSWVYSIIFEIKEDFLIF